MSLPSSPSPPARRQFFFAASLIVLAVLAAYSNSFSGAFVYDDRVSLTENETIRNLWPLGPVLHPPVAAGTGGRPFANLTFALSYSLSGLQPWGYHLLNLAIHTLAALALFGVVRRTLLQSPLRPRFGADAFPLAAVIALLWAVHPLLTQSVTYVSQRTESLMALFYLLTLYGFIRGAEARPRRWYPLAVAACLLGVLSKEIIATAPLLVLLYDRTFVAGTFAAAWRARSRLYLALAATWLPLGILLSGLHDRGVGYDLGTAWFHYALTECQAVVLYLSLSVWPHPLVFDHGATLLGSLAAAAPYALGLAALGAGIAWALVRRPALGFAGAWFLVILAPTSSVIPIVPQPIAENRPYLPSVAVVALVVLGLHQLASRRIALVTGGLLAGAAGVATFQRNHVYQSELSIWTDTVAKAPRSPRAHYNLGVVYDDLGHRAEAIACYEVAVRLAPGFADPQNNLGNALAAEQRFPEAIDHLQQALRAKPDYVDARYNLGNALLNSGHPTEAVAHYEAALRLDPRAAKVHSNLGVALVQLGRNADAIPHFERAIALDPHYADPHNNLAVVLGAMPGRLTEAIAHSEAALRIRPGFTDARRNLEALRAMQAGGGTKP